MKICLKVLMVAMVAVLGGCTPRMNSKTANTAAGHGNCTETAQGLNCSYDSKEEYKSCVRFLTEQMGPAGADAYCTCKTQGGTVVPSQNPAVPPTCYIANSGAVGGGGVMGGYGATSMMPQRYANYPGSSIVMVPDPTPQGVVNMENAGGGGRFVPAPGGSQPASSGGASQQDVKDSIRSQIAIQAAHCKHFPADCICNNSCKK
ncbi:hypothetical protein HZC53_01615 [Candidatus Uhrbacteria bacterium]|nr:hypothetical protein [Candidatus Uhrbacteria bacterium]